MRFPKVINWPALVTASLVLGIMATKPAQEVQKADQYCQSRDSSELTTVQQTSPYQYWMVTEAEQDHQLSQRITPNNGYDSSFGYERENSFINDNNHTTRFRWNDVAGITAMALGAYILFR